MFRAYRVFSLLSPGRPRHPIVQALIALFAICAFLVLLGVGLVVAAVALVATTLLRAFAPAARIVSPVNESPRAQVNPRADHGDVIDGEFSVVKKSISQGIH